MWTILVLHFFTYLLTIKSYSLGLHLITNNKQQKLSLLTTLNFNFSGWKASQRWRLGACQNFRSLVICSLSVEQINLKVYDMLILTTNITLKYYLLKATLFQTSWNFGENKQQPVHFQNILGNRTHYFTQNGYQKW